MTRLAPLLGLLSLAASLVAGPVPVVVETTADGFRLLRGGEPYFVRGAGGLDHLEELAAAGGNCVRTWGSEQTEAVLDEAHRLGLTVVAGLWVGQERHGMNYQDPVAVEEQFQRIAADVRRFKDHPALLAWGLGNELDLESKDPAVWDAVGRLAEYIREVDPHHPVMTVTAWVKPEFVAEIKRRAPAVTILGINAYGGLNDLPRFVREAGWEGPYLVAEWGPNGPWETKPTSWGVRPEPSSTRVARIRAERHAVLLGDPRCLGGHVFKWGKKQEYTATWFSMFLADGTPLGSVDAMTEAWGRPVQGLPAPRVQDLVLGRRRPGEEARLAPGEMVVARLRGFSAKAPHSIEWRLRRDDHERGIGGDPEAEPELVAGPWTGTKTSLRLTVPQEPGKYRLYAVIRAGGKAATANVPFLVEAPAGR